MSSRHSMRRLVDSQELLATVRRRLDLAVRLGKLRAVSVEELWGFLFTTADHVVVDVGRALDRIQTVEREDGPLAEIMRSRLNVQSGDGEIELERMYLCLTDPLEREILTLWLLGTPHTVTAEIVGLTPDNTRWRWAQIRRRLRETLEQ